jgi:hypothetical protein
MDLMKPYLPATRENHIKAIRDLYQREKELWAGCIWYKIYELMTRKQVWLVTNKANLPMCKEIGLTAFESIDEAFKQAMAKSGSEARVAFVPYGRYTVIKQD